jgi:hypothetical protein
MKIWLKQLPMGSTFCAHTTTAISCPFLLSALILRKPNIRRAALDASNITYLFLYSGMLLIKRQKKEHTAIFVTGQRI